MSLSQFVLRLIETECITRIVVCRLADTVEFEIEGRKDGRSIGVRHSESFRRIVQQQVKETTADYADFLIAEKLAFLWNQTKWRPPTHCEHGYRMNCPCGDCGRTRGDGKG